MDRLCVLAYQDIWEQNEQAARVAYSHPGGV